MEKEIAFKENTIARERLPFPIVLYPGHYGSFFAFRERSDSEPYFCSCTYEAIENYIRIKHLQPKSLNSDPRRMYIIDSYNFPVSIVEDLMRKDIQQEDVMRHLYFGEKLCHECNLQTPSYRYCHEMYGGAFKQNYGWYIGKQAFEWGFDGQNMTILNPDSCPDELLMLVEDEEFSRQRDRLGIVNAEARELEDTFSDLSESDKNRFHSLVRERIEIFKTLSKHHRKIANVIENEVRRKFGHKNIGESWTSETILYYIVKKLFPTYTVRRHYRPDFLQGLELDIYIEELNLGIEYQGIQHYKPIKHWGGKEALTKLQERDKIKKDICRRLKIPLVYFEYNEGLSDEFVQEKLDIFISKAK